MISKSEQGDVELLRRLNSASIRLSRKDHTLWGETNQENARNRLGWIDLPEKSRALLPQIDALTAWSRHKGLDRVLLCAMGGSSLAPEVICESDRREITILDSTDPSQIRRVLSNDLEKTVAIISSKSGSTLDTDSLRRALESAFLARELDPKDHIIIITDPLTPLALHAEEFGYRHILSQPDVGGRFSALSVTGLLPSALAGVDISELLEDAHEAKKEYATENNSAVQLAASLISHSHKRSYFALWAEHGVGGWIEQLVAESTGKNGLGLLPILIHSPAAHSWNDANILKISVNRPRTSNDGLESAGHISIQAPLGELFILWEWAIALVAAELGVNPFDQPNVEESKATTVELLAELESIHDVAPRCEGLLEELVTCVGSLESPISAISAFLASEYEYIAVMAYLDREGESIATQIRDELDRLTESLVTFGWGPRFLHSTGQFHKGGRAGGAFLQITSDRKNDLAIPGQPFTFHQLILAQALGDEMAIRKRNRPFLRLHLREGSTEENLGLVALLDLLKEMPTSK